MHLQVSKRTNKDGSVRKYGQLARSYRSKEDGKPKKEIVANLGRLEDWEITNWRRLLDALREERAVELADESAAEPQTASTIHIEQSLQYLPVALAAAWFEQTGLYELVGRFAQVHPRAAALEDVLEALVVHRCIEPGSKRQFQSWLSGVACQEIFGTESGRLNNTRVHRALDELAQLDDQLQSVLTTRRLQEGDPRVVYLDLTDVWFESGGGETARRAPTKAGHRWKLKIHVALLIDENGMPLQWEFLSGALNEAPELPKWLERLNERQGFEDSVLIFDRGMQSVANFKALVDQQDGHLFLSSVRHSTITSYVELDEESLDELQSLPSDATAGEFRQIGQKLGFKQLDSRTFMRSLGVIEPPEPSNSTDKPPELKMYLYFNPEMRRDKRKARRQRFQKLEDHIDAVNQELRDARRSRKPEPTRRKATKKLDKMNLLECFDVRLEPYPIEGKTRTIDSFQIELEPDQDRLSAQRRYDGLTLLVAHPGVEFTGREAVEAYRHSSKIEANFRMIKSDFDVRPVYHYTDPKIRAHIILCILALMVERAIEQQLAESDRDDLPKTAQKIWEKLDDVQLHRLRVQDTTALVRNTANDEVETILEILDNRDLLEEVNAAHMLD